MNHDYVTFMKFNNKPKAKWFNKLYFRYSQCDKPKTIYKYFQKLFIYLYIT